MANFKIGSIAAGMGLHLHGLKQMGGVPVWAIEMDEAIAHCYAKNHDSQLYTRRVEDISPDELADIDLLTVTLSCKNASPVKGANRGETAADIGAAIASASILRAKLPKFFLLENVWAYRNFDAFKEIQKALSGCGYYFQSYRFNLRDWGIAQSRERLYCLGVRHGAFYSPIPPSLTVEDYKEVGWYEAISDLIPQLPQAELAKWQQQKFPQIPDSPVLLRRCGGGRDSDRLYHAHEPAFTIRGLGRNSAHHSRVADAVVEGRAIAITPRACLRLFGDKETADSIWLPPTKSLAGEVVGNGASWVIFRELARTIMNGWIGG